MEDLYSNPAVASTVDFAQIKSGYWMSMKLKGELNPDNRIPINSHPFLPKVSTRPYAAEWCGSRTISLWLFCSTNELFLTAQYCLSVSARPWSQEAFWPAIIHLYTYTSIHLYSHQVLFTSANSVSACVSKSTRDLTCVAL